MCPDLPPIDVRDGQAWVQTGWDIRLDLGQLALAAAAGRPGTGELVADPPSYHKSWVPWLHFVAAFRPEAPQQRGGFPRATRPWTRRRHHSRLPVRVR